MELVRYSRYSDGGIVVVVLKDGFERVSIDYDNLDLSSFIVRINIDQFGKVNNIMYGSKDDGTLYSFTDAYLAANRESSRYMRYGRQYLSRDVSTIVRAQNLGILDFMRFPCDYIRANDDHVNISSIIQNAKSERTQGLLLIPYEHSFSKFFSHAVVLLVDLSSYPNRGSIVCFDSSHCFCTPTFFGNNLNINEYFNNCGLENIICSTPLNKIVIQGIFDFNCTHYAEAFMLTAGEEIVNNNNIGINDIKNELDSKTNCFACSRFGCGYENDFIKNIIIKKNISLDSAKINGCCCCCSCDDSVGFGINIYDLLSFCIIQNSIRISNIQKQKIPIIPNLLDVVKNLNVNDTIKMTSEYSKLIKNQNQLILDMRFLINKRNVLNENKFEQIFVGIFNGLAENDITKNSNFLKDFVKKLDSELSNEDKVVLISEINKAKNNKDCNCKNILNLLSNNISKSNAKEILTR